MAKWRFVSYTVLLLLFLLVLVALRRESRRHSSRLDESAQAVREEERLRRLAGRPVEARDPVADDLPAVESDGLRAGTVEATPTPAPTITLEEPRDVSRDVRTERRGPLTIHHFSGRLGGQPLRLLVGKGVVWLAGDMGLVRHDRTGWWQFGADSGLPGPRVADLAQLADGHLLLELQRRRDKGAVDRVGNYRFVPPSRRLSEMAISGWSYFSQAGALWVVGRGLERHDFNTHEVTVYGLEQGLLHQSTSTVLVVDDEIWIGHYGDYRQESKDFTGGGVTRIDAGGTAHRYGATAGLAQAYTSSLAATAEAVWAVHWKEDLGISRFDRESETWRVVRTSRDGIALGGPLVASAGDELWIGQQRGLVRYQPATGAAVHFKEADGLPGYIVSSLAVTDREVWATVYAYGDGGVRTGGVVVADR